jgi:hypothetical protein
VVAVPDELLDEYPVDIDPAMKPVVVQRDH